MSTLLIFGMGYTATSIATRVAARGWQVSGTARSAESLERITAAGFAALPFGGAQLPPELAEGIASATHLLISIPPDEAGDPVLRCCASAIGGAPSLQWIGYLSTIGVYGDHDGGWVDETTAPEPISARSKARLTAEEEWTAFARTKGVPLVIFRLPGIYGPGRSAVERLLAGEKRRIFKAGQVFNRIHVEDIAHAVERAATALTSGPPQTRIFNITDDEPAPPQDVTAYAAELLGMAPPPLVALEDAGLSRMAQSFYGENKRVRNERMKRELGVSLAYPTYREGLRAIAEQITQDKS